jgi:hypothetical protein
MSFRDVHHEKSTDQLHIRLISEGGSSVVGTPGPVCIESIQVTQTCTSESQHTVYRSATGACTMFSSPDTSLFSLPSSNAVDLDDASIPHILLTRFDQQGVPLSAEARIIVKHTGKIWAVSDQGRTYTIRKLAESLTVYRDLP